MINDHDQEDAAFDALLRDLGPDVPRPELTPVQRRRLASVINGTPRAAARRARWNMAASIALIATLGVTSLVLGLSVASERTRLARARWESQETLDLLMSARRAQAPIPPPNNLAGVRPEDLVLVTFDHELCPIARVTTPAFRSLATGHESDPAQFIVLDVTGDRRDQARQQIDAMDLAYALFTPLGGETGVVKVLDITHRRVLCAAPGQLGIKQAQEMLARVSAQNDAS